MSVKIKICGIRTMEAARAAVEAGADFLGFNFVPSSKRFIEPKAALEIINSIRGSVKTVGVFQDAQIADVNKIALSLGLDFVQLHGSEKAEYCKRVEAPVIKAFLLPPNFSVQKTHGTMISYSLSLYLLDRKVQGEGAMINLQKAREIAEQLPLFFSGGLTPENLTEVIGKVHPFAVDVSGGIETDGIQDLKKIKRFIQKAKGAIS